MSAASSLLRVEGLTVRLGGRVVLRDVDLEVGAGEIVTIVGPNGSGKTTLLRAVIGAARPASGRIVRRPDLRIGYVPQRLHVDASLPLTVARFLDLPQPAGRPARAGALREAGVPDLSGRQMSALSGGQFQRVLLARALIGRPDLLILDEATQGLDQPGSAAFYRQIETVRRTRGCAVLMVSHELHVVMAASDRVVCLNGHVCCAGTPEVVASAPAYRALFGSGTMGALGPLPARPRPSPPPLRGRRRDGRGLMLDDFLVRAALAGVGTALAAAPLGCFVVWRRMAFFGDATAHAAILGVALSLAFSTSVFAGALAVALAMALTVDALADRGHAMDTVLGVLAHSALAVGLVAASFLQGVRLDLGAYLFGDILAVSRGDLGVIWGGAALVAGLIGWRWRPLLTATLNDDLARSEGIDPRRERLVLTLALAVTVAVAVAIKVVGALLIAALLIVPAAAARPVSRTPEGMALVAALIGVASALAGLAAAWRFDTPAGPSIVCAAAASFAITSLGAAGCRMRS